MLHYYVTGKSTFTFIVECKTVYIAHAVPKEKFKVLLVVEWWENWRTVGNPSPLHVVS